MALDPWLPVGHELPDGPKARVALFEGVGWQILATDGPGRALMALDCIMAKWVESGLVKPGVFRPFMLGEKQVWAVSCGADQVLCPVSSGKSPDTKAEAMSFALALKATRDIDRVSALQDAIYAERISRLLPTYSISSRTDDDIILGYWLTGGASISAKSLRRLGQIMSWLGPTHLRGIVEAAGVSVTESLHGEESTGAGRKADANVPASPSIGAACEESALGATSPGFQLAGRSELEAFFNEHVIDIVQNRTRYEALGIDFPSAIVLHGPPGCGKTFAVERLVDHLGWPMFQVDASSVASPYIHETSKKIAEVFSKAMTNSPSVLIIDEMEAFLADRDVGSGQHHVEEVAEFLRRIPEATKNHVLIVAMTNRVDMIDAAVLRRGRFDHVVKVDLASETEVLALLAKLLATLPMDGDVELGPLAKEFAGRPLSDVTFVVREAARLAAHAGRTSLNQDCLWAAADSAPAREHQAAKQRRIGFI